MKRPIKPEEVEAIQREVELGKSYWQIASQFPHLRQHEIREAYKARRPKRLDNWVPEPAMYAQLKQEVQASWEPETWSRRWVGRYANANVADLQSEASKLMPY
jgi:hypothetical protein